MEKSKNEDNEQISEESLDEDKNSNEENVVNNRDKNGNNNNKSVEYNYELKDNNFRLQMDEDDEDVDIINELNEKLDNLSENFDSDNIEQYSRYENLSEEELKIQNENKREVILKLNEKNEDSKKKLNMYNVQLNDFISKNANILFLQEPDPMIVNQLEALIKVKEMNLLMAKQKNQLYKDELNSIIKKNKNNFSNEKLNQLDSQIDNMKKENSALVLKIRELRDKSNMLAKEQEIFTSKKKYANKIFTCTEEIKNLTKKKQDYNNKMSLNKKSLDNTLKEFNLLLSMYNSNIKEESDKLIVSKIKELLDQIKNDLNGTQEDILTKVDNNESYVINLIDKSKRKDLKSEIEYLPMIDKSNIIRTKSANRKNCLDENELKNNKGIFFKFSYLNNNDKKDNKNVRLNKRNILKFYKEKKNVIPEILVEKDYENTTEKEYKEILSKKEQYDDIITRLEKSIKEKGKISDRKIKNIQSALKENKQKLNGLVQQTEQLKSEIGNLNKILDLTIEQNKIKKELKTNESIFIKSVNQKFTPSKNIPSISGSELLMELKEEAEEKKKNNISSISSNINEKEQGKKKRQQESNKKKISDRLISNFIVPDLSNEERIKENIMSERERRLNEIKMKYITISDDEENFVNY